MKNLTMQTMVAAAALVVAGGVASAQVMKAEIPFRFQAAGAWLEPGTYMINHMSGPSAIYRIANLDAAGAVLAMPQVTISRNNGNAGQGKLVFECVAGQCALVQLWDSSRGFAYSFNRPKRSKAEAALASTISIRMERAE